MQTLHLINFYNILNWSQGDCSYPLLLSFFSLVFSYLSSHWFLAIHLLNWDFFHIYINIKVNSIWVKLFGALIASGSHNANGMGLLQVVLSATAGSVSLPDWLFGEEMKPWSVDSIKVVDLISYVECTTVCLNGLKNTHWDKQSKISLVL